jgi:hypothetical protein
MKFFLLLYLVMKHIFKYNTDKSNKSKLKKNSKGQLLGGKTNITENKESNELHSRLMSYSKISKMIQFLFEKFLSELDTHPFFRNYERSLRTEQNIDIRDNNTKLKNEMNKIVYQKNSYIPDNISKSKFISNKTVIPENFLNQYFLDLQKTNNYETIEKNLMNMSKYNLPTTVDNIDILLNQFNTANKNKYLNVCILGGGPIGMFLGLYLEQIFNTASSLNNIPKMNILIIDNRKAGNNLRDPFTRYRSFAFSSKLFSLIIPKMYCWKEYESHYMNINILENMLYLYIYNRKINYHVELDMEKLSDYNSLLEKGNFDAVFDCTGGRLKNNLFKIKKDTWLDHLKYSLEKEDLKISINKKDNLVKLEQINNTFPNIYYFCEIKFWQINPNILTSDMSNMRNHKLLRSNYLNPQNLNEINYIDKLDIVIRNEEDLKYMEKLAKLDFIKYNEIANMVSSIKDKNFQYKLLLLSKDVKKFFLDVVGKYIENITGDKILISFYLFNTNIHHSIEISKSYKVKDKNILYIGAGDTIFHSHWLTGAGLNRTIDFTVKCVHLMSLLYFANNK